ncbi:hypothetical protein MASR2M16_14810 [Thauera terpenica]
MLVIMENEAGEIIGAGIAGAPGMLKSLRGEDRDALEKVRSARARLKVGASDDPTDPDGLDDDEKIAVAAEDGRLAGAEEDIKVGRGTPLRKSFAPAAKVPALGILVTARSLAGRGITLTR